jgi:hypothetical protein
VGVEPTILAAKDRINGFEGHEDHRAPGASVVGKSQRILGLMDRHNFGRSARVPRRKKPLQQAQLGPQDVTP